MLDTMTSWFSVNDALTRVAVMVCVVCVTGGQLGAVQGPVKTYSFEGVESIRVVQCDGVGKDVVGVKIHERRNESKDLVIAGDKKSGLICTTNSSFTACTVQREYFSKNISVRIIITDLKPGEVREYTCGINRETGDGSTAATYHHINVTRPEITSTTVLCPATLAAADQSSCTTAHSIIGVLAFFLLVSIIVIIFLVRRIKGLLQYTAVQQNEENPDTGLNDNGGQPAPSASHGQRKQGRVL